jgi:hypothetical protein
MGPGSPRNPRVRRDSEILIADAVMLLDNVVAIAAAAHGSVLLITLGLVISIPLIMFSGQLVLGLLNRYPILVVLGGGLLGCRCKTRVGRLTVWQHRQLRLAQGHRDTGYRYGRTPLTTSR